MQMLDGMYSRRSVRRYTSQPVERNLIVEIIRGGTRAPSGLNNQPWRFIIVSRAKVRGQLAEQTKYARIVREAPVCIAVFLDRRAMYHEVKDHQAMGACIQNMLLAAHALGLGAVWLGEILKNAERVRTILEAPEELDLMAVVAVGHPSGEGKISRRRSPEEVIVGEF